MRNESSIATVSLALAVALLLAPAAMAGGRGPWRTGGGDRPHDRPLPPHGGPRPFGRHPGFHHRHHHRSFGAFAPIAVIAPPLIAYAPPFDAYAAYAAYGAPAVVDPPVGYGWPAGYDPRLTAPRLAAAVAPAPDPPPMPRVVEYPTGRYELHGDGMTVAYTWVWIPNPPPLPPIDVAPATPPASEARPARPVQLYHWTDGDGVEHWTDRREAVPEAYRTRSGSADPS